MKVLSIDIVRRKFDELTVTEIIQHPNLVELKYDIDGLPCISGMMLSNDEFELLIKGNAVELHVGEIVIVKVD
jgi:hypothetical protein